MCRASHVLLFLWILSASPSYSLLVHRDGVEDIAFQSFPLILVNSSFEVTAPVSVVPGDAACSWPSASASLQHRLILVDPRSPHGICDRHELLAEHCAAAKCLGILTSLQHHESVIELYSYMYWRTAYSTHVPVLLLLRENIIRIAEEIESEVKILISISTAKESQIRDIHIIMEHPLIRAFWSVSFIHCLFNCVICLISFGRFILRSPNFRTPALVHIVLISELFANIFRGITVGNIAFFRMQGLPYNWYISDSLSSYSLIFYCP